MKEILKVVGIGELLWDVLPEGKNLGGAPCNFVYHAQKQGASGLVLSAVGDDDYGREILEILETKQISADLIQINDKPTSTVDVLLSAEGIPDDEEVQIREILNIYGLKLVALTKGHEGSLLVTPADRSYVHTPKMEVKDTVGAGVSFTAAMITGFTKGQALNELHRNAVEISAFVCTRDGAMPEYS